MSAHSPVTYELVIHAGSEKSSVIAWLQSQGVDSFVEGSVDGIDVEFDYSGKDLDPFASHGGEASPIIVYKYEEAPLLQLANGLQKAFGEGLRSQINQIATSVWQEGWKESFKPIATKRFYVYPPWEAPPTLESGLFPLEIEPGMAFGTGQHATTKLCLSVLETILEKIEVPAKLSLLDVGTGTGILAIAAAKFGCGEIEGHDIDTDSILAANDNAMRNQIANLKFVHSSSFVPRPGGYDFVIANILSVVLKQIFPQLKESTKVGGELLMSGILAEEREEMVARAAALDFQVLQVEELEGWILLRLRRS